MKNYFILDINKVHRLLVNNFLTVAPFFYGYVFFTGHNIYGHSEIKVVKDLAILILLVVYIIKILKKRKVSISISNITVFCLLVFGTFVLIKNPASLSLKIFRSMIEFNLMFFIVSDIFLKRKNIINFLKTQLFVGLVISIIGVIEYSLGGIPTAFSKAAGQTRIISTLFNPNALGWYLCIISLINLSLILKNDQEIYTKKSLYLMLFFYMVAIFLTGSRSSIYVFITSAIISYLLNNPGRLLLNSLFISFLIFILFSYTGIDLATFRIIASGFETERVFIANTILNEISFMKIDEILFGSSHTRILKLDRLGLLFDSQIIIDFILGGLFYVFLKYSLIIFTISNSIFKKQLTSFDVLLATVLLAYLMLSVLGNITSVFPHAVLFWVFIKLSYQTKNHATLKDLSETAIPN